jgi:hypothetical protein
MKIFMTRVRQRNHQLNCEALESRQLLSTGPVADVPGPHPIPTTGTVMTGPVADRPGPSFQIVVVD